MSALRNSAKTGGEIIRKNLCNSLSGFPPDSLIGIAYSGGMDSTVLLHACARFLLPGFRLCAFHVDHGLRPAGERFLEQQVMVSNCMSLGIPLFIHVIPPGAIAGLSHAKGSGIEAAARTLRYEALDRLASEQAVSCVLSAHHEDDFIEGLTMGFYRGQYPLRPIPSVRGIYRRPLLDIPGQALSVLAETWNLTWHEDSSNAGDEYLRNRIRHGVIPGLQSAFKGMAGSLRRTARLAEIDEGYFVDLLSDHSWKDVVLDVHGEGKALDAPLPGLETPRADFLAMDDALAWRFLRQAVMRLVARGEMETVPDALCLLDLRDEIRCNTEPGSMVTVAGIGAIIETGSVILVPRIVSAHENDYLVVVKQDGCFRLPACGTFEITGQGQETGLLPLVVRPLGTWISMGLGAHPGVKSMASRKARGIAAGVRYQGAALGRSAGGRHVAFFPGPGPNVYVWNENGKIWIDTECVRKAKESEFKL